MSKVSYTGVFVSDFGYENRGIPKAAGWWFHPGNPCSRSHCKACAAGFGKGWWTPFKEKALKLSTYFDESAKTAAAEASETAVLSSAATIAKTYTAPSGLSYMPFQNVGVEYILGRKNTLLADEMGIGKTIQALGAINNSKASSVLVICPASLRLNWLNEAEKWLIGSWSFYVVRTASVIPADATFLIVNYEMLKGAVLEGIMGRRWDVVIVDEAHMCKNEKSIRSRVVLGKRAQWTRRGTEWIKKADAEPGIISRGDRVLLLTGTPILNRPIEMYPLIYALDPKTWNSRTRFARRYCDAHETRWGWDYSGSSVQNLGELQDRLRSTIMIRRTKGEVLKDLPAKTRQLIALDPNGAQDAIDEEERAWGEVAKAADIEALEEAAELAHASGDAEAYRGAIAKLESGYKVAFEAMAKARKRVALAKVGHVIEHVKNMLDQDVEKVVVWAHHYEVLDALHKELGGLKADGRDGLEDRQAAVNAFQNDKSVRVLTCGIRAMGVGHTLTAASHVVFAELDWTPAIVTQAEDRCHRIGQKSHVLVQHLVLNGSLDAKIAKMLLSKQEIIDHALDKDTTPELPEFISRPREPRTRTYPKATAEQRKAAAEALQSLAGVCDGAREKDGMGFNKFDAKLGLKLAMISTNRALTDGEVWLAKRICPKYRGQVGRELIAKLCG